MTKVVIYSNTNLESFYEQTLQYLHEKYHTHPTMLNYGPLNADEAARISYYDGLGRDTARHAANRHNLSHRSRTSVQECNVPTDITIGKMVF
jgi:hypothetical protein